MLDVCVAWFCSLEVLVEVLIVRRAGCQVSWVSGQLGFRSAGCQVSWVSGQPGVRSAGCQVSWVSGQLGVRSAGCQVSWGASWGPLGTLLGGPRGASWEPLGGLLGGWPEPEPHQSRRRAKLGPWSPLRGPLKRHGFLSPEGYFC